MFHRACCMIEWCFSLLTSVRREKCPHGCNGHWWHCDQAWRSVLVGDSFFIEPKKLAFMWTQQSLTSHLCILAFENESNSILYATVGGFIFWPNMQGPKPRLSYFSYKAKNKYQIHYGLSLLALRTALSQEKLNWLQNSLKTRLRVSVKSSFN